MRSNKGFTIIELLIVIVIIGILVAITAVSYTGITNGANTAAAQSNASAVKKKVIACQAKSGSWPADAAAVLSCDSGGIGLPSGVTVVLNTALTSGTQKTAVGYAAGGAVYYWDSTIATPGAVALN